MRNMSVAATIALAAIIAIPGASYAASKLAYAITHKSATDSNTCTGGGCTAQNPDRVTQPCNGSNCYKRTRKHKSSSNTSRSDTSK